MQDKALELLQSILDWRDAINKINKSIHELDPEDDFCSRIKVLPSPLEDKIISLLDDILGCDNIASYYLYEASRMKDGGSVHTPDGRTYRIKNIADVKHYINHQSSAKT